MTHEVHLLHDMGALIHALAPLRVLTFESDREDMCRGKQDASVIWRHERLRGHIPVSIGG